MLIYITPQLNMIVHVLNCTVCNRLDTSASDDSKSGNNLLSEPIWNLRWLWQKPPYCDRTWNFSHIRRSIDRLASRIQLPRGDQLWTINANESERDVDP